jgi:beta-glucosidase
MGKKLFLFLFVFAFNTYSQDMPYKNSSLSIDERIKDLLGRMTLEEKIAQMRSLSFESFIVNGEFDEKKLTDVAKGLSCGCVDGILLTAKQISEFSYKLQKFIAEKTRLAIPVIVTTEALHGAVQDNSTIFPQALAQGSTFNPGLINKMTKLVSRELKAQGVKQVLSPDLDLARELRWGRVEETFGEDPYLAGRMGVAFIKGFNENNIICTPKHFAAHGSPNGGLNLAMVAGGERELRSIYLKTFEAVIKETSPLSIMNAYSSYDRVPIAGSKYFLTDILRNEWGFKGYVYSDWGSVGMLYNFHRTVSSYAEAGAQALKAGLDFEIDSDCFSNLDSLVKHNLLDVSYIDKAVERILRAKFSAGLFENPYADRENFEKFMHQQDAISLSGEMAEESVILLKNEQNILPIKSDVKSISIVGPNADQVQFGDYSWTKENKYGITPLQAIRNLIGDKVEIKFTKGCDIHSNKSDFTEAINNTNNSDLTIVFVGSTSGPLARNYKNSVSGEGYDLSDLKLPGVQEELIKELHKTGKPIVVVLVSGKPFAIPWIKENIPAILVQWYGGELGGKAIADILFGKVNPSGRLNVSFPQSVGHLPVYYNYYPTDKGYYKNPGSPVKPGQDYVFSTPDALWPFGYGLSYTTFGYTNLEVSKEKLKADDAVTIKVTVTNNGKVDGKEVVQLYVRDKVSSVVTPIRELKRFEKVFIKAGENKTVTFTLPMEELALYNTEMKKVVEPGQFELQIGTSAEKILLKKIIEVVE